MRAVYLVARKAACNLLLSIAVTRLFVRNAVRDGRPVTHTSFEDDVRYMASTEPYGWVSLREGRKVELAEL